MSRSVRVTADYVSTDRGMLARVIVGNATVYVTYQAPARSFDETVDLIVKVVEASGAVAQVSRLGI